MKADILIVDDEPDIRKLIKGILEDEGYSIREADTAEKAYAQIGQKVPDLVIQDIWLQNSHQDGMQILETVKKDHEFLPFVMISGHGTIETAVGAIKIGAYDFIEKPFKSDRLLLMIERALETASLRKENISLKAKAEGPVELVGNSTVMTALRQVLRRVAQSNSRILITGEPGTGKDIAARTIHKLSPREDKPFKVINCAILHPERLELELFGSEPSFNDNPATTGVLEKANGGTLLLDEVADMPIETQGKIVRVLQEQRFRRLGGQEEIEVDVRIIASTNRDLKTAMEDGDFRQDLYYRLSVVPIEMPPLRERTQDIKSLAEYFVGLYSEQNGVTPCTLSSGALAAMQAYEWPGNVRQLRNVIEWLMIMNGSSDDRTIKPDQLPPEINTVGSSQSKSSGKMTDIMMLPLRDAREKFEKAYLESQIQRFNGNISKTSEFVGMERSALHRKMKQLGISTTTKQNETEPESDVQDKKLRAQG